MDKDEGKDKDNEIDKGGPSDSCSVALREYDHLWEYYIRLIDERARYAARYIQVVAIPAAIIAVYFHRKPGSVLDVAYIPKVFSVLAIALLLAIGLLLAGYYVFESLNARSYLSSMKDLRTYFCKTYPELEDAITIDPKRKDSSGWDVIPFFRIMPFFVGNAAIAATIVKMTDESTHTLLYMLAVGFLMLVLQYFGFRFVALWNFQQVVHHIFPWPKASQPNTAGPSD